MSMGVDPNVDGAVVVHSVGSSMSIGHLVLKHVLKNLLQH